MDKPICFPIVMDTPTIYRREASGSFRGTDRSVEAQAQRRVDTALIRSINVFFGGAPRYNDTRSRRVLGQAEACPTVRCAQAVSGQLSAFSF
jgi:hypothetical protein